ncbi:MAG: aldo/keto reductase [Lautropia sp.]
MRYRQLGQTGLFVSELCLGTMTFGKAEGIWAKVGGLGQQDADALVRAAVDAGVNFIDTADVYSGGNSERITGQALKNLAIPRDEIVIATKGFGQTGEGPNGRGASRHHLIAAAKASLARLQLEHVDLYQVHGFDPATPVEETLAALDNLVQHGHVRYVGVSNWAAWQVSQALGIAALRGFERFACLQAYYTVAGRDLEREIVPMLLAERLGLMVWSPLAGGLLSGKYAGDEAEGGAQAGSGAGGRRADFDFPPVDRARAFALIDLMRPMAQARGASVAQVALAWLLHQPVVTSVIVGATRLEQLADNLASTRLSLTQDELERLDEAGRLAPEYPGWMLAHQGTHRRSLLEQQHRLEN